ncbi:hypothetical protein HY004_02355 [Candidatus Saccharibacteria bacterium]|nr:hypothetical protein [Candidatus Saccharibacteria bacterium]
MSDGEKPPTDIEEFKRAKEDAELEMEPPYVELFDILIEDALFYDTQIKEKYAQTKPEFDLDFGKREKGIYYILVRLQHDGELSGNLNWVNPALAKTELYYFITNAGELVREISLSTHEGDSPKNKMSVTTDLGKELGEEFANYLFSEPWSNKEKILKFCQLSDDEKQQIDEIYKQFKLHHIGKTAIDDSELD